ncbi:MAG: hypothetical protein HY423_15235 [Candidatus Lambdaproteobacteria bacterium]|nr:hypothetical protein [Candidatus Lambdaproteobacteria bacterium]
MALALLLALPAACERRAPPGRPAPAPAGPVAVLPAVPAAPFGEWVPLEQQVREIRAILPRVPAGATLPAVPAPAPGAPRLAPRLALRGAASLLQPERHPGLPGQLALEVYLDEGQPPGGYLAITPARVGQGGGQPGALQVGGIERWPILAAQQAGSAAAASVADEDVALLLRVTDPENRLRHLYVLSLGYGEGSARYRALEGYLFVPAAGGALAGAAVYPVDFGYRWPEPPAVARQAAELALKLGALRTLAGRRAEALARAAEAGRLAGGLRKADVPPGQQAKRQADLREIEARARAATDQAGAMGQDLRALLLEIHRGRAALAEEWIAFTATNPYRWRGAAGREALYRPLAALAPDEAFAGQVFATLGGAGDAALAEAQRRMAQALEREAQRRPGTSPAPTLPLR